MKDSELLQEVRDDVKTILASLPSLALRVRALEVCTYGTLGLALIGFFYYLVTGKFGGL